MNFSYLVLHIIESAHSHILCEIIVIFPFHQASTSAKIKLLQNHVEVIHIIA